MTGRLTWPALLLVALGTATVVLAVAFAPPASPAALPPCPPGTEQVASHSYLDIEPGARSATVAFALADGCRDVEVSLASYRVTRAPSAGAGGPAHEQVLYDADTGVFSTGEVHELTAAVDPDCYHHVTFVLGPPPDRLDPARTFEEERERTVSSRFGGTRACSDPLARTPARGTRTPPPGAAAPDTAAPGTGGPGTGTPGATAPDTTSPATTAPEAPTAGESAASATTTSPTTPPSSTVPPATPPPTTTLPGMDPLADTAPADPEVAAAEAEAEAAAAGPGSREPAAQAAPAPAGATPADGTSADETSAAEPPADEPPADPGTAAELPFTGPGWFVFLLVAGLLLVSGGVLMLLRGQAGRH